MIPFVLSEGQEARFREDGFFIAEGLFDAEEIDLLRRSPGPTISSPERPSAGGTGRGGSSSWRSTTTWATTSTRAFVRCRRIVDAMERLLGGEVYHYHHKMILKEPYVGGAWEWHQDYGYWYHNGCLFPTWPVA